MQTRCALTVTKTVCTVLRFIAMQTCMYSVGDAENLTMVAGRRVGEVRKHVDYISDCTFYFLLSHCCVTPPRVADVFPTPN